MTAIAMPDTRIDIVAIIRALRRHYGRLPAIPTKDPFELILWENVAYLAPPERRAAAFALLKSDVGTAPSDILSASDSALERVTAHGILKSRFAAKLRTCAELAMKRFGGDLRPAAFGPLAAAKKALRQFPGIGEPGAEKILLFADEQALLAPDSNALRVLSRLGLIKEQSSYTRMYAASREVAAKIRTKAAMREAHTLLQHHGQTLCKRGTPKCSLCPVAAHCAYIRVAKAELVPADFPAGTKVSKKPQALKRRSPSSP
jgi:endonuclease III